MTDRPFGSLASAAFWAPRHFHVSAWLEHAPFAFAIVQMLRPRVLVELGSHHGFSYLAFCQAVERCGLDTKCYAVDTWEGDNHAGFYGPEVFNTLRIQNEETYSSFSTLLRCRFDEALPHFADGEIDLLHIDGRHTYEDVVQDFTNWRPKLSNRAVVLFHDTNVRRDDFGVWRLWQELSPHYPSFEFTHGNGLGVLALGSEIPASVREFLESDPDSASGLRTAYAHLGGAVTTRVLKEAMQAEAIARAGEAEALQAQLAQQAEDARKVGKELEETNRALMDAKSAEVEALQAQLSQQEEDARKVGKEFEETNRALMDAESAIVRIRDEARDLKDSLTATERQLHAAVRDRQRLETFSTTTGARLHYMETSTFWRLSTPLRDGMSRVPPPMRRNLRRMAKAGWWLVTPHRTLQRLRYLRNRSASSSPGKQDRLLSRAGSRITKWAGSLTTITTLRRSTSHEKAGDLSAAPPHWFDADYYRSQLPDPSEAKLDPFAHYATIGWREGRDPHPLFNVGWYLTNHPHLATTGTEPLSHFLAATSMPPVPANATVPRNWRRSARDFGDVPTTISIPSALPSTGYPAPSSEDALFEKLDGLEILSLDIFDTALVRRVVHPTTVFDLLQDKGKRRDGRFADLADLRFWAERSARQASTDAGGTQEIGLAAIYDTIARELHLTTDERQALETLELDIERDVLVANPRVLAWYRRARAEGHRTIFVSDMYLPTSFLEEVLAAAGYEEPEVYASSAFGLGKWEQKLFAITAERIGVNGNRILHLGDNHWSDKACADAAGWHGVHYAEGQTDQPFALQIAQTGTLEVGNVAVSIGLGLSRVHRLRTEAKDGGFTERFARHLGYEVVGPTILAFAGWVAAQAQVDRLDRVLFLARDGFLLQQVYEMIRAGGRHGACGSRYVLASRRMLYNRMFSTSKSLREAATRNVGFSHDTTLADYLDIFLLSQEEIETCAAAVGIDDIHSSLLKQASATHDAAEVRRKLDQILKTITPIVTKRAAIAAEMQASYYRDAGALDNTRRIGLVDLGWSGTIIEPLQQIVSGVTDAAEIRAYFFGLTPHSRVVIPHSVPAQGYFFDKVWPISSLPGEIPSSDCPQDVLGASLSLVEVLISQNCTTATDLVRDTLTGKARAIYAADSYTAEQRNFISIVHEAALEFARDALPLLPQEPGTWNFRPLLAHAWNRILSNPSESEAKILGSFPHRVDASGRVANTTLVTSEPPLDGSLLDAFRASMWPAGWAALLDPTKRAQLLTQAEMVRFQEKVA